MTIETSTSSVTYTGNGATTVFSYAFLIPETQDAAVYLVTIADNTSELIDPSQYTILGIGDPNGGTVEYELDGAPLTSAYKINIARELPLTQAVDLTNQDGFYPEVLEGALDTLCMQVQQLQNEIDRAVVFPAGTETDIPALTAAILAGAANAEAAEESATEAAASAATVLAALPIGIVMEWPNATPPALWFLCDGSVKSQTTYAALFAVCGTTYNTGGEGAGNFRLPNHNDRVVQGKSGSTSVGQTLGAATVSILQANLPNVSFTVSGITLSDTRTWGTPASALNNNSGSPAGSLSVGATIFAASQAVTVTGGALTVSSQGSAASGGSGTGLSVVQPTIVMNKIIFAGVA